MRGARDRALAPAPRPIARLSILITRARLAGTLVEMVNCDARVVGAEIDIGPIEGGAPKMGPCSGFVGTSWEPCVPEY